MPCEGEDGGLGKPSSVVLSALEFDVLWSSERLPRRHVALDVPSPGKTENERTELVGKAWDSLRERGLVGGRRATVEIADALALLANPTRSVDAWMWTDRQISALAVVSGSQAVLGVVDGEEVWLIPARDSSLAEAAVSVAGQTPPGRGQSVSVPSEILRVADEEAGGDPARLIICLESRGIALEQAQLLAGMLSGMTMRGQFGVERRERTGRMRRASRIVAFHDTANGRYVYVNRPSTDGRLWSTITPADNNRLVTCVLELFDEL